MRGACYIGIMEQKVAASAKIVHNPKTGEAVIVRGAGALKDSMFTIKKSVDLTKPIAKQALRGKPSSKRKISPKRAARD
jgi:imidazoleglycerol phosphate synthase glutamine amidotransferase subunit HisH